MNETLVDMINGMSRALFQLQHRVAVLEAVSPGPTRPSDPTRARGRVDDPRENQLGERVIALVHAARAALDETDGTAAHMPLIEALRFFELVPAATEPIVASTRVASTRPPDPTPKMLDSPEFNVVWDIIKSWDVDHGGGMRSGATGNDAAYIVNALRALRFEDAL